MKGSIRAVFGTRRRLALGCALAPALVGCADAADRSGSTDCASIQASDALTAESLELRCDPASGAKLQTRDCTDGVYVLLIRPEGDLEGIVGRSLWRVAPLRDPETGRTPFAVDACQER